VNSIVLLPPAPFRPDFSLSLTELARRCAYWLRPGVPWTKREGNEYSDGGNVLHHAMSSFVTCENGINLVPPEETELRALYVSAKTWLIPRRVVGMRAEVAFAYDTATGLGRELVDPPGELDARWYVVPAKRAAYAGPGGPIRASEVPGRVDLVCLGVDADGGYVRIWDYKFHFGPEHQDAQAQLELLSLAVARTFGLNRVQAIAVHVWEDRFEEETCGVKNADGVHELGEEALREIAKGFDKLARSFANDPQPTHGAHCDGRYCPAVLACPIKQGAVVDALSLIPPERLTRGPDFNAPVVTNADAAFGLAAAKMLVLAAKAKVAEIEAWADANGGVDMSDGKLWGAGVPYTTETPNLEIVGAVEVIQALGADFALKTSTTLTALREIGGDELVAKALAELAKIDAVKISAPITVYMARKPKAGAKTLAKKRTA
jgi:hypothetical protein